jgi:hypothetical protein
MGNLHFWKWNYTPGRMPNQGEIHGAGNKWPYPHRRRQDDWAKLKGVPKADAQSPAKPEQQAAVPAAATIRCAPLLLFEQGVNS